jgi:hypothetical protein
MKTILEVIVIFFFMIGFLKIAKIIIDYLVTNLVNKNKKDEK